MHQNFTSFDNHAWNNDSCLKIRQKDDGIAIGMAAIILIISPSQGRIRVNQQDNLKHDK